MKQVVDKKVLRPPSGDEAVGTVTGAGNHQQIEVFARFDQGVHKPQRGFGRHVDVQFANDEEEFAFKLRGVVNVRALRIPVVRVLAPNFFRRHVAHPLLVPR